MSANAALETADIVCANGMPAFLACPKDAKGPLPVVVLMHERYGLVQHTRDQAMRCARDGYFVLAPNFFFRHPDQAALNKGDRRRQRSPRGQKARRHCRLLSDGPAPLGLRQPA